MRLLKLPAWLRPAQARDRSPGARLALTSFALAVLLVAFVILLWAIGIFDFHKKVTAGNAKVYAAVLGLVGGLFATAFTFLAALLKYSIDVRTLGQAHETERRLRLETSIRAVELLTEEGKKALPTRQAGALFVLGSLDQLEFALPLLGEIWPENDISPAAAVWVVNRALLSDDPQLQDDAALALLANARSLALQSSACFEWPPCISFKWKTEIDVGAREKLLDALIEVLASKSKADWDPDCVSSLLVNLDLIRRNDDEPRIRNGAALAVSLLFESGLYDAVPTLFAPEGTLSVPTLRAEVAQQVENIGNEIATSLQQRVNSLRGVWVGKDGADRLEAPAASVPGLSNIWPTPAGESRSAR
jgi:hypothetical protein